MHNYLLVIEYCKLGQLLKLSPVQWNVYTPEPGAVDLDNINGLFPGIAPWSPLKSNF